MKLPTKYPFTFVKMRKQQFLVFWQVTQLLCHFVDFVNGADAFGYFIYASLKRLYTAGKSICGLNP